MEGISLSYIHNKGSFLSLLGLPESFDICAELVHKFGGDAIGLGLIYNNQICYLIMVSHF